MSTGDKGNNLDKCNEH